MDGEVQKKSRISHVAAWLKKEYKVQISKEWLTACFEWIVEEEGLKSNEEICHLVYEQLIHSDLAEVVEQGGLEHIDFQKKGTLEGIFFVQINSALDVSCSAYSMLQKQKNIEKTNKKSQESNRLLLFDVTDGRAEVKAMEYTHLQQIDSHMNPGAKALIQGSVKFNLGVLMLSNDNVRFLGGHVETLCERNKLELLLQKELYGQDYQSEIKSDPEMKVEPSSSHQVEAEGASNIEMTANLNAPSTSSTTASNTEQAEGRSANLNAPSISSTTASNLEQAEGRSAYLNAPSTSSTTVSNTEQAEGRSANLNAPSISSTTASNTEQAEDRLTLPSAIGKNVSLNSQKGIVVNSLDKVKEHNWRVHPHVVIKAHFSRMVNKISPTGSTWTATLLIQDDRKETLEVSLSNEILEELIGFSAIHFISEVCPRKSDASIRAIAGKGFGYCQSFISKINCFMLLGNNGREMMPCIIKLLEMDS